MTTVIFVAYSIITTLTTVMFVVSAFKLRTQVDGHVRLIAEVSDCLDRLSEAAGRDLRYASNVHDLVDEAGAVKQVLSKLRRELGR